MEYNFRDIEGKWKKFWEENHTYRVSNNSDKPKCYVLDMFPYPSGAGLHVGHPLGYIASDIYARYKRLCGYNVLHPMGFDAFGLPAEQYALETGQHPAVTTEKNIARYREQLDNIGFCYDWKREVRTSDPNYYKWTQWIFLQLFHSWYDRGAKDAKPIAELIKRLETEGNINTPSPSNEALHFDAATWHGYDEHQRRSVLMQYRLAYQGYAEVWWCEGLGTVLANDEVVNGVSERGGFPVERKRMRQWFLRITEYADRLLKSLDALEWSEAMKEMQRNWIGKSVGAEVEFKIQASKGKIEVFTTRPDTIFGVDFMVLAPEHELVDSITTPEQHEAIAKYKGYVKSRSERERMAEVKQITGAFTGAYALHPFTGRQIPIWISEYVLAGYGTGAIMAVPSGDTRDHSFAKHFNIPITNIFGDLYNGEEAYTAKEGILGESDFLNGLSVKDALPKAIEAITAKGIGKPKVNFKMRDAGFSRQRYWGEPFPIVYINGEAYAIDEEVDTTKDVQKDSIDILPVELPMVESYKPGPEGEGPLANVEDWMNIPGGRRETSTMPGYAGSSWYFLRYMDPHNEAEFADRKATDYWREVDVYIGGTEHAVGHLLYSRLWTKVLHDLGYISFEEPFKKLINQGMIQGRSALVLRITFSEVRYEDGRVETPESLGFDSIYISHELHKKLTKNGEADSSRISDFLENFFDRFYIKRTAAVNFGELQEIHVPVELVDAKDRVDINGWKIYRPDLDRASFALDNGNLIAGFVTEKMSKRWLNVVNPDDIVAQYGADTFRMYEMFLGPIDVSKPWDTKGIEGVHRFLKKLWRLFYDEAKGNIVDSEAPTDVEQRIIHKTIKKIGEDIERFSLNTAVSQFMICVNDLSAAGSHKREVLEKLAVIIAPFAPHLAEELWQNALGNSGSVLDAQFPAVEQQYVTENTKLYPVAVNGKTRIEMEFALDVDQATIEQAILADATIQKWMEGKQPKKVVFVQGKMINVVV